MVNDYGATQEAHQIIFHCSRHKQYNKMIAKPFEDTQEIPAAETA